MRDLLDAPEPEWRAERAKIEREGWGARLLSYEDEDGQWAGGAFAPNRWRYDVLHALDYFRSSAALTGAAPDPRLGDAVKHVRSRRRDDGTWARDWTLPGRVWFEIDEGPGRPSHWVTLRARRVLRWWDAAARRTTLASPRAGVAGSFP